MKKVISVFLVVLLLFSSVLPIATTVSAAKKTQLSRAIGIVFDNSGSMYIDGNQAWCRATYAMEVFASMLNKGDTLQIYPMHPITVGGTEYSMESPFQITDASQASLIRDIYTTKPLGTPIESIDAAVSGVKTLSADKKYVIVLTDGDSFYLNGREMNAVDTKAQLDSRFSSYPGEGLEMMYLGIGENVVMPDTAESKYFAKKQAKNSEDALSSLTEMCNQIFGRDTIPKTHLSGKSLNLDISISKLIVFVQGENVSDLKVTGKKGLVGKEESSTSTRYGTAGNGTYESVPDTSLQGMMVTYTDCAAGEYTINYGGNASNIEVYYEPNADLEFIFTDSNGNNVDLNSLYEGEYKVSFGLKDGKTGKLISSDLLGSPHYEGSYSINGEKTQFSHDGYSGEVPLTLKVNDVFEADLTVTYLSGYTISKNSTDFGWPEGGVKVIAPPLGNFETKLTVSETYLLIKELSQSPEMVVDLSIEGKKLTAEEFDAVTLTVDCGGIAYTATPKKEDSQYIIQLENTDGIDEGKYEIKVTADYLDIAGRTAQATDSAKVTLSNTPLWVKWLIGLLLLLLLAIILWIILHIRVLPTKMHTTKKLSTMNFDGDDVTRSTNFLAEVKKQSAKFQGQYAGKKFGLSMDVVPGKESYLYKPQKGRSAEVKVASVRKFGPAKIQEAMIGSTKYVLDEDTGKLVPALPNTKPFNLTNGMMVKYSGTIQDAGIDKDFEVTSKLNFKKK